MQYDWRITNATRIKQDTKYLLFGIQIFIRKIAGYFFCSDVINGPIFHIGLLDLHFIAVFYVGYIKGRINKYGLKYPIAVTQNLRPHVLMFIDICKIRFYDKRVALTVVPVFFQAIQKLRHTFLRYLFLG